MKTNLVMKMNYVMNVKKYLVTNSIQVYKEVIKMYVERNFKTKKAFKEAVENGEKLTIYAPGLGEPRQNGSEYIEGPWYPEPHRWYATVEMKDGIVVKVK